MNPLHLHSETFSPGGSLASIGLLNQLGRPHLDILQVLVREAVQNSWDARASDRSTVRFGISGWQLSEQQLNLLKETIFRTAPENLNLRQIIRERERFDVLAVYDRGTTGLAGPTRADVLTTKSEPNSFINFIRNVGQPPNRYLAGGTYGYGKAAFYRASEIRTICVYTRCLHQEKPQSRFIVAALGEPFEAGRQKYTGRHWWGRCEDGIAEPLIDGDADKLAENLGLPLFAGQEKGTVVLVLLPIFGERTPLQAMNLMAECLLWYFWPKMLADTSGELPMEFELFWQGQSISVPPPTEFPPLQGFVQAMQLLKGSRAASGATGQIVNIESKRPKKHLGVLSLRKYPIAKRSELDTGDETSAPIQDACRHVALMRQAELVVKYLVGPPLLTEYFEYAGVFIADEEVDPIFADAEPPTHDDWVHTYLEEQHHRTFIRVALNRIKEAVKEFSRPVSLPTDKSQLTPLGSFANQLGGLLPGQDGPGATFVPLPSGSQKPKDKDGDFAAERAGVEAEEKDASASGSRTHRTDSEYTDAVKDGKIKAEQRRVTKRAKVELINEGELILFNGVPALLVEFAVKHAEGSRSTSVRIQAAAVLDGNELETEPPAKSIQPKVVKWIAPDGTEYDDSTQEIQVPSAEAGGYKVIIAVPHDVVVGLDFTAAANL